MSDRLRLDAVKVGDEAPVRTPIPADGRVLGPNSARRPVPSPAAAVEASI